MASRDVPNPFREGFSPSPTNSPPSPGRKDEYDGRYPGNPGKNLSDSELYAEEELHAVENPPIAVKNLRGR